MSNKLAAEVKAIDKKDLRYLWYLPVYILAFVLIERVNIGAQYHEIHMFLDDLIPFSAVFPGGICGFSGYNHPGISDVGLYCASDHG